MRFNFFVCAMLIVLLPQAPGKCGWNDVNHLLMGGHVLSFSKLTKDFFSTELDLPDHEAHGVEDLIAADLETVEMEWKASRWHVT